VHEIGFDPPLPKKRSEKSINIDMGAKNCSKNE